MAQHRPAGYSDDDSDSDYYGEFYDKPQRYSQPQQENVKKKIENNLTNAIINGSLKEVEKIISCDLNGNVNSKLDSGWTPLLHACFHAQDRIVKYLLDRGADPNLNSESLTPIMLTCSNSSASDETIEIIVNDLLEKDCILNVGDKYGQTPLMRAISSGRLAAIQKLLDKEVNIEMRDKQGWTALFWAVHHNQPEILKVLIEKNARLNEVDMAGRRPVEIAYTHDYKDIIEILEKDSKKDDDDDAEKSCFIENEMHFWTDFYPGLEKGQKPTYKQEIAHLLYGMNCEKLAPVMKSTQMDLRTFLLLEERDMINLGVDLPYERKRLKCGLRSFHVRGWKLNSVAGLYAKKIENYSVLDCLTTLGSHLQQLYILEATLQYSLREYTKIQDQMKYEPPDSPNNSKMKVAAKKMLTFITSIRNEMAVMKRILTKISNSNGPPADLIKVKSFKDKALEYIQEIFVFGAVGIIAYQTKNLVNNWLKK